MSRVRAIARLTLLDRTLRIVVAEQQAGCTLMRLLPFYQALLLQDRPPGQAEEPGVSSATDATHGYMGRTHRP